ncbi:prepilin-type N-terminal cleavage/methylation domain-containing protein [Thiorhodococcus mannitoliphagus]|uniref:Prepilin-type N-terminal cleavage/methylation domain-containing protein n=1 Tax=Thiorhodococcus mannitoliphagus TaxID=329406 RepID=A0A6P1E1C5_9GAMM|nr:type IV pilin protein [Thiorhodococcus mannitoliphagus]NEX21535.1 prepilin-type N-terminal cleavage/methylation domain-containing protein [Thiorhodococcus mannitoliphagus]
MLNAFASPHRPLRQTGFTLLELLITLAIVGILAALAYPSYQQQVRQARRADGQTALMRLAIAQEKFRGTCPRYADRIVGEAGCAATGMGSGALGLDNLSVDGHYRLQLDSVSARGFQALAAALGNQTKDQAGGQSCRLLSIDQDGNRMPRECW